MDPIKECNICGTTSNDTAIFSTTYAKGNMNICLQCLSEGVLDIVKDIQKPKQKTQEIKFQEFSFEDFDFTTPEQVFGFNCEDCGNILFSNTFPVSCNCGHINNETVIHKQDLLNRK